MLASYRADETLIRSTLWKRLENESKVTRSVSRPSSMRHGNEERMASDAEVAMMIYVVRGKIGPEKLRIQWR